MMAGMSAGTFAFLAVRALHVLLAAAWLGSTACMYLFLPSALEIAEPASARLIAVTGRRDFNALMASVGGVTVLTGIWLYWHFTGGFEPAASATIGARVFGAGGAAGILALVFSGAFLGRTARKMAGVASKAAATADAVQRAALMADIADLQRRLSVWGRAVLALQILALVCMAVGHYV